MPSTDRTLSARQVASAGLCIGCGACAVAQPGIRMRFDAFGQYKPVGPGANHPSAVIAATCPFSPYAPDEDQIAASRFPLAPHADARIGRYEAAYVGAVSEGDYRDRGSSGGLVTWVAAELMRQGLVDAVVHVAPSSPQLFSYRISRSISDLRRGAKSRYYPIELSQVLGEIRRVPGRYAIVGIPCFIKAVHLACADDQVLAERVAVTLGLFCGHMKSARFADSIALQLGTQKGHVRSLDFRVKHPARPANWYRAEVEFDSGERVAKDWWHLVDGDWGAGFFQNSACNACDDVVAETADISFGDAWVEPYSSDGRGTNVVVVRDALLRNLLQRGMEMGRLDLAPVDADFVVATQAAGFRQRRLGLAYRLSLRHWKITPRKRVSPLGGALPIRRKMIYRQRMHIAKMSHRLFWLARRLNLPLLYLGWARIELGWYQALAYSRGPLGRLADQLFGRKG